MRLKFLFAGLIALVNFTFVLQPVAVFAASSYDPTASVCDGLTAEQKAANQACEQYGGDPVLGTNGNGGIIMTIANLIAWLAGAIAVIMMIFAAFRIVKSSGDSGKVTQARETILYALVGLVVIVLARIIVGLVISKL
jgi:hypothetical protein